MPGPTARHRSTRRSVGSTCCRSWSPICREHRTRLREEWAERIQQSHLLVGDDAAGDGGRDDLGLRQLRRGARDRERRGPAALRARPVRADHPPGGGDPRGGRHRAAAARRARPVPLREVPARLRVAQRGARRLRAGCQPDRQHRRGQLRRRARAGHPPAAGRHPRAVDAGAAGARAAAHPAHHRRARQRPGPPADGAAAVAASASTAPRSSSSTSRVRPTSTRPWRTTSCRPSTRHASWVRASSSLGCHPRSPRRS